LSNPPVGGQARLLSGRLSNFQTIHMPTPWLNELREYFLVHALIGSGYTTYDLLFYVVGGVIGYGALKGIETRWSKDTTRQQSKI